MPSSRSSRHLTALSASARNAFSPPRGTCSSSRCGAGKKTSGTARAAAILALARIDCRGLLSVLVDAISDPQKEVRIAAAQALVAHGSESASLLLRFKARTGDKEPEVITECLCGLLTSSPTDSLPFVSQFLDSADAILCEAAVLALGRSRLAEAFDLLKARWQKTSIGLTETIFLAMAMLLATGQRILAGACRRE